MASKINVKSVCLIRNGNNILAYSVGSTFQKVIRLPGGKIKQGESSIHAVRREIKEELGVNLINIRQISVLEHIGEYKEKNVHDIIFIFTAEFSDISLYEKSHFKIIEAKGKEKYWARWIPISELYHTHAKLYPEGLLDVVLLEPPSIVPQIFAGNTEALKISTDNIL